MAIHIRTITAILLCAHLVLTGGCSSMRPVADSPDSLQQALSQGVIEVGDRVEIVTVAGTRHQFDVTQVSADGISGKDRAGASHSLAVGDLALLKKLKFSGGKTAGFAVAGFFAAASLALATGGLAAWPAPGARIHHPG